jgi:hypothetical protein
LSRYRVMYWKDIPQSFTVEGEGRRVRKEMPQRVQVKIDAYAMAAGLTSGDEYTAQYQRGEWLERDGSPEEVAEQLLVELDAVAAAVRVPKRSEQASQ